MKQFHDYRFERGLFKSLNSLQPGEEARVYINPITMRVVVRIVDSQHPYDLVKPEAYVLALTYMERCLWDEKPLTRDSLSQDLDDVIYQEGLPLC